MVDHAFSSIRRAGFLRPMPKTRPAAAPRNLPRARRPVPQRSEFCPRQGAAPGSASLLCRRGQKDLDVMTSGLPASLDCNSSCTGYSHGGCLPNYGRQTGPHLTDYRSPWPPFTFPQLSVNECRILRVGVASLLFRHELFRRPYCPGGGNRPPAFLGRNDLRIDRIRCGPSSDHLLDDQLQQQLTLRRELSMPPPRADDPKRIIQPQRLQRQPAAVSP